MRLTRFFILASALITSTSVYAQEFSLVRLFDVPGRVGGRTVPRVGEDGVFLDAMGPNGYEVFGTDGFRIASSDINPAGDADPWYFTPFGGHLYFTARSSEVEPQFEWYRTDGLSFVPVTEADVDPTLSTTPSDPYVQLGRLYFHGNGPNGRELYAYDGETLEEVEDLWPGEGSAFQYPSFDFGRIEEVHGKGIFAALTPEGARLFSVDGTVVTQLSDRPIGVEYGGTVAGEYLYFPGPELVAPGTADSYLFRTDGTVLERVFEYDLDLPIRGKPRYLAAVEDSLYFVALGPPESGTQNQVYLFRLQGDEVTAIDYQGIHAFSPEQLVSANGKLILEGFVDGKRLVFTKAEDGPLRAAAPEAVSAGGPFGLHEGWFYFQAGTKLYRTDAVDTAEIAGDLNGQLGGTRAFVSTSDGLFLQPPGAALHWTDGDSVWEIGPVGAGGLYFEGAFYYLAQPPGEDLLALYKVVRADAPARADFNRNGVLDAGDLDILAEQTRSLDSDVVLAAFDLDQNEQLDLDDRRQWVHRFAKTVFGDANLDGAFTSADLVVVLSAGQYEDLTDGNSTWASGDWNGDGEFTTSDLVIAFQDGGYEIGAGNVQSVPEPSNHVLTLAVLAAASGWYGRSRRRSTNSQRQSC